MENIEDCFASVPFASSTPKPYPGNLPPRRCPGTFGLLSGVCGDEVIQAARDLFSGAFLNEVAGQQAVVSLPPRTRNMIHETVLKTAAPNQGIELSKLGSHGDAVACLREALRDSMTGNTS